MKDKYIIINDDCLHAMSDLADKSIDLILTDLPYSITKLNWDKELNLNALWKQYNRIIKDNGAIVLFAKEPFTSKLVMSNIKNFRYKLIWKKPNHDNPMMAKKRFLNVTEDIVVFYKKQCIYNPQGMIEINKAVTQGRGKSLSQENERQKDVIQKGTNYPRNILEFKKDKNIYHPTQKPVTLLEYLIKSFTNKGGVVLDSCMGSGSTGIACMNTDRTFIGIELDDNYYKIAEGRLKTHEMES